MPDVVKQAFDAIKDSQLFLDEADFREQLSKSPKDVYGVLETTGLFLDYEDFTSSMALKKKDDSIHPLFKEQSELEADLLGKSVAPFSRIELPEPRTQSLSELQKAVEEKEKQLQEVVLRLDKEKKTSRFEITEAGVPVESGDLWSLKQEAKRLENEISETKLEAIQLSKKQSKERVLETRDELVQTTKETAAEVVRLKDELKSTEAMLRDISATGLFKMPIKERISKSEEGQAKVTEIENRIREIEEAQRKDLNNVKAKYQDVAEDLSVLMSRQNNKYDIKSKLLEGYETSPFEDIREDFEKSIGVDEGILSDISPFSITEQDVLVSKLREIQELQDEVSFRIDQIGENFTSTSDLIYSNWLLATLGSMESLGTYISLGGMGQDMWGMAAGKGLEVWAQGKSQEHIDYVMPFMEYSQSELGDFKWNQMYDPLWWKTNGGGLAGSMTFFGTVGLLSALTANPLVGAMGLSGGSAMLAGGLISSGISSPVLAAVYGGTAYKNVLNQLTSEGVDTEEAIDRASIAAHNTFKTVLPVSLALNTGMMGLAYKTVFTGVKTSMLGKAVDIAKGAVYSGMDNLWQENTTRYFTEKALGVDPTGIFAFDPYAQHAFAAGAVMNFGHVMLGGVTGTMKGVVGKGNVKGYEAIAEPFVQANLALGKDRFAVEATAASLVKQGRMTKQEATQFITETVELMDDVEFQQLKGVAAVEYAKNKKMINEAQRVLEKNEDNSAAKKIVNEKESRNSELAMNAHSDLNVVIEDGQLVAYDMNGAVVEYDAMNEKQRLHYDTVKEKEPFTPLLNEPVKGKYTITQNNNKQTFDNVEEFLVALEALDVSEDTFVSVQEEEGTGVERANQILERKLPKISEITAGKVETIEPTTEGEKVAQKGDIEVTEALKDVESTAKALGGKDIGQETVQQPIGEQPIADEGGVITPDVSQDRTMAAEATREGIVASFDVQPKQIKEKEFGFVQKELTKAWTNWKKANKELGKMPQRVQNLMREKVIRMTPETKEKTMEFLTRVMTNETYAKNVNSVAEKLEKYGKTKPIGEMRPFVRALMKIPPKARYFHGKDEMRIMLGRMDISNEMFTNKMLAELDSALDDVTAKKQDFTKLIDFVTKYQDEVQRALIQNVRDVDVNSRAIPKFLSALDKLETQKELVEEQLTNNEIEPQDVISLQKKADGLERWIKNMKKEGAIKEFTTEEGKKIREAEDRLKYLEDFLNNGYNELQEKARNLYDEATEGAKNVLLNDIKDSNTTSESKEVSEAIENIKKSAAILLENSNGRKFLNLSKLDMLKHALNQYKETGVLVKDLWSSEQEINTAAKAGRVMELTEKMQGLKGWLQKRRVRKIAESPKALSALYTDLVDMYIGIEGKNNAPYYESLGYQFDLAATRAKIETRNDLKKVNEAFMKALNKTQLGKIINLESKKDFVTLKRIGMVYASLRHYHLQTIEPILKDGKYYAVNKGTGETSQPFNTIEEARKEIDSNKEKYVGNLDLVQSLLDKDAQSKANLSSNSIKNKMLLDADMEAYKSLSKDGLIVRNMDDAKKLLKPEEFQAMVALMDFYTKYQEKAKIVANRAGKDLALEQFYMPFNLYTEFSDGVMADNVNNLINTASNEAGVTLTGRVESKQTETNAWINFNAMDVVHNYAADMNVSYHLLPLLKQEMGAFKRLKDMYHAMRDSERDGFSNSDMSKIASNMLEDRMQRFRNEVKMGVIFGDMSVGFMLGDKYIDVGKGLRRIQRVSRVKKLLDVVRPILDGAPQIMRQVAEGVGLTGIGYEQFNAKRIQELTELYEYVPEGSAMAEVLDTSMNRFDMPNWTVGTESTLQQFTSFMLSQADRLTKQMGWSAMFDKQCMELMGSTIDMKRFRGDEVYRNSVLKDPLFDKAVTLADRYTSSVHFARTSGASRGNILGGKFGLKQGTSAYALFTPLMSYMLHQSQYALSSVSNTLFGSELGRTQEARRVLGVIANNMTYSILAGSVLTLRKILIAKMADREEEEKELWKEFKDRFTREGAWNNVVGGTVQLIASSGGAFGPNVMNTLVSVGETLLTESESDGVKTRLAKKRWSEFRRLTGTGLYEIGDLKKGKISLKHVANTALPLLGGELYDIATGVSGAISYGMYMADKERDKVLSENEQAWATVGLINDIIALGVGGYYGAKDVEKISDGMASLARKKPMNLKIMDYQDFASFNRTIQSAYEAEIKNIEYRETKTGELKYRIEYDGETRVMTSKEMDELIKTVGDRNIINNKGINSYARAEAMMDSEFSYPDYEFTKEPITYRQFQAGMEKNEIQNKWLMDTYEYIQTERSIPLNKKYELFRALEGDTEGLAKAVWNNEFYGEVGKLVNQWIEKELMNMDKKVALQLQESITNVHEMIKKYK